MLLLYWNEVHLSLYVHHPAGTSHRITRADLKPSKRVVRERRKQAMQGPAQARATGPSNAGAGQDVYDADELVV
jgi:hypothetical protein